MAASSDRVRNVVLVVFDTLRLDAVGSYGTPPPWGAIATPVLDAFARESVRFTRAYPESLPTLCARRALYTGQRTYPFHDGNFRLKGDFPGVAPGWGPIPEAQHTLAEIFQAAGFRTGLIADVYHMFKPSKNFWRGFDQWTFIRGQETDPARSGPAPSQALIDRYVPRRLQDARRQARGLAKLPTGIDWFSSACVRNMHDRVREELWFNAQVMQEAARWLEQNRDAERFFLTVESFDPHEPWFVPEHYRTPLRRRRRGRSRCSRPTAELPDLEPELVRRTRANYAGLVTMCDRWLGHLLETLRAQGRLDDTLVVVASDHGHTLWERRAYIGKRGYPSDPEVYDVPLLIRHPAGLGAGTTCDAWVQHHDLAAYAPGGGRHAAAGAHRRPLGLADGLRRRPAGPRPRGGRLGLGDDRRDRPLVVQLQGGRAGRLPVRPEARRSLRREPGRRGARPRPRAVRPRAGGFPGYVMALAASAVDAPGCSPIAVA